jgi:hypothetical protein
VSLPASLPIGSQFSNATSRIIPIQAGQGQTESGLSLAAPIKNYAYRAECVPLSARSKFHFFENFVPQIPEKVGEGCIMNPRAGGKINS